jgi:hypothetical protein
MQNFSVKVSAAEQNLDCVLGEIRRILEQEFRLGVVDGEWFDAADGSWTIRFSGTCEQSSLIDRLTGVTMQYSCTIQFNDQSHAPSNGVLDWAPSRDI